MTRFSPTEYAAAERRRHHRSTAMLVATMAVVITAVTMLGSESFRTAQTDEKPPSRTNDPVVAEQRKKRPTSNAEVQRLLKYLSSIKGSVPQENAESVALLVDELDALGKQLASAGAQLNSEDSHTILLSLNALEPRLLLLNEQSIGEDENFAFRLDATRIALEEQAVAAAIIKVQEEFADKNRKARLALSDELDKSATLNQKIAAAEREQIKLRAMATRAAALRPHMADVRKYLSAFTSPGYLQPISDSNPWHTKRTAEAMPVSLSALQRLGALEKTMEGYERLYKFGGGRNAAHNNKRKPELFPEYFAYHIRKTEVRTIVERAQQLLRDHGEAMVEAKMLLP